MTISTVNSTTLNSIFYWRGVVDPEELLQHREVSSKIQELLHNRLSKGTNLKKLKDYNIYRIKTNDKNRILFTDYQKGGKKYLLLLDYFTDHKYGKSKVFKPGVLERFTSRNYDVDGEAVEWEDYDQESLTSFDYSSEDVPFDLSPVDYYKTTFISFNDHQGKVLQERLPLLVSGPPGSGKSCVALSLLTRYLSDPSNHDEKSIAFVCLSENLASTIRGYWEEQPASQFTGSTRVTFLNYEDFLKMLKPELGEYTKITYEDACVWLEGYIKQDGQLDVRSVFEEFQILSSYSKEEYFELGKRQSLYDDSIVRENIFNLFLRYKEWLRENNFYDIRFEIVGRAPRFDLVVVDEAQDLSGPALLQLYTLAGGNISYFMDTQQDLEDRLSKRSHLKQLMYTKGVTLNSTNLPTVYRCPQSVLNFANRWLGIKAYASGGIADKDEYREINVVGNEAIGEGHVFWHEEGVADIFSSLRASYKETEIAIVVSREEDKESFELRDFGRHLLFTPEEIKGLEFPAVILFKPFELEVFKQLNKQLQGVDEHDLCGHRHRAKSSGDATSAIYSELPELSKVFTTITRTEDTLLIYQPLEHNVRNIHRLLESTFNDITESLVEDEGSSSRPSPIHIETSETDWLGLAERYLKQGAWKKFTEVCTYQLHEDPQIVKFRLTGQQPEEGSVAGDATSSVKESGKICSTGRIGGPSTVQAKSIARSKKARNSKKNKHKIAKFNQHKCIDEGTLRGCLRDFGKQRKLNRFLKAYSIDCRTSTGLTPLMATIDTERYQAAKLLIANGADVNLQDNNGATALMAASEVGNGEIVQLLLDKGASVNTKDSSEYTALLIASESGHTEVVQLLLENGANPDVKTAKGKTPLADAIRRGHKEIIQLLLEHHANANMLGPQWDFPSSLEIIFQVDKGGITFAPVKMQTPLMLAVEAGDKDVVELLLQYGANIDEQDTEGYTPLLHAVRFGDKEIVKLLIMSGADSQIVTHSGRNIIMEAIRWHGREMAEYIVKLILESKKELA